jgi:hypothetical protein
MGNVRDVSASMQNATWIMGEGHWMMNGSRRSAALLVQTVQDLERRISKDGTPDIDGQTDGHRVGREERVRDCSR